MWKKNDYINSHNHVHLSHKGFSWLENSIINLPGCKIEWIKIIMPHSSPLKFKVSYEIICTSFGKTEFFFYSWKNQKDFPSYLGLHWFVFVVFCMFVFFLLPSGLVRQDFIFARAQLVVHQGSTKGLNATILCSSGKIICCCYSQLHYIG